MRLPWPFNRPQRAAPTAEPVPVFGARARGPQAWRDLPVLARSVGAPPLVAPAPPFRADLAGAAPAPIALAPLGHGRGADAPTGVARNVATAVAKRPAQESEHSPARSALVTARRPQRAPDVPTPEPAAALVDEATASPQATPEGSGAVALPAPKLASEITTSPVAARPSFVSARSQASLPLPPTGRIGVAQRTATAQRAPLKVEPVTTIAPPPPALKPPAAAPITPAVPRPPTADRLTLGQARRLGLGAPLDGATLRAAHSAPAPQPAPGAPPNVALPLVQRPAVTQEEASPPALTHEPAVASTVELPPQLPNSRAEAAPVRAAATSSATPARMGPAVVQRARAQRAPRVEAVPALPLVGARPVTSSAQRAPLQSVAGGPSGPATSSASAPAPDAVRIRRGSEAEQMAGALDARAFTHQGEIFLPDRHGPLTGQKAQSLLAHEMTHVVQQRRLGSNLPTEDSPHGQHLEAQAVAAEKGGALPLAPIAERAAAAPSAELPNVPATLPHMPTGERAPSSASPAPQRAREAHFTDPDDAFRARLDSNEEYLFGRFERRLRRQLISERERGGTLIDAL